MNMDSEQANKNIDDRKLNLIAFKACHVAVWSDSKMMAEERRAFDRSAGFTVRRRHKGT